MPLWVGSQSAERAGNRVGVTRSTQQSPWRWWAWYYMRVTAVDTPLVMGCVVCAPTEEDQKCRNGQMRNSRRNAGLHGRYMMRRHGGRWGPGTRGKPYTTQHCAWMDAASHLVRHA